MTATSKYLILIPARRGSSFHGKNLYPLSGLPLIRYTIQAAKYQSDCDVMVSTDCHYLKAEAETQEVLVDERPANLADDKATLNQVAVHIAEKYPNYPVIILLPPTSPLRNADHLREAIEQFEESECDSLISVTNEYRTIWKREGVYYRPMYEADKNRQEMEPAHISNGAIFICKRDVILKYKKKMGGRVSLYEMRNEDSVDIHTKEDIELAEWYLGRQPVCNS